MKLLSITKPGIIFGNIVTVCGGFFLGSQKHFDFLILLYTLIGMAFVIACGCVVNNVYDKDIDGLMKRTQNRAIVLGMITRQAALLYAFPLGVIGLLILYFMVNPLTMYAALVGLFFYVIIYTILSKRNTVYGTAIGAISGAMPPVVGYSAATNRFDLLTLVLFLILFFWQMPHFYAIAICRLKDFENAKIPVLPLVKGVKYTKVSMLVYIVFFTISALLPTLLGAAGYVYFAIALCLGLYWLYLAIYGFNSSDDRAWARKVFLFSILAITILSIAMIIRI